MTVLTEFSKLKSKETSSSSFEAIALKYTVSRLVQFSKTLQPVFVKCSGILIDLRFSHALNAL